MAHPIKKAFDKLPSSIKNMAMEYPEGRNVLIYCLTRSAGRTDEEVVNWLIKYTIGIYKPEEFRIRDDQD